MNQSDVVCHHCGNVNDFRTELKSNQLTAWCNCCDAFIKNISQGKPPQLYFGKYKDRLISSMATQDELNYLEWLTGQPFCKTLLKSQIKDHLTTMKAQTR